MKKFKYVSFLIMCMMFFMVEVAAASLSVNVTSTTMTLGNSVTVTAKFDSKKPIFFTEGNLKCSGAGVSNNISLSFDNTSNDVYSKSFSLKVKPTTTGVVTCTISGSKMIDASADNWQTVNGKTIKITVNPKPISKPKVKSSNNYLSSLTIDGYELDSKFDKEYLEYSVTVKEGTEKIKINAQKADSNASVSGTGEVSVTEGLNTFNLVVTAENGSKRTYVLKVTVKEYAPINVNVDGEEYSVVRKRKGLPEISEYFIAKDITIGEDIIEGYYNENLDYQLVGLKDSAGNVEYYIYKDGDYSLYNEQVFNGKVLRIIDKGINGGYKKTSFKYNDTEIDSYQEVKLDIIKNTYALDNNEISGNNFYLFYAINMETGKEELYQYDSVEKTVQRYNTMVLDMYKEQSDKYYLYLLCSILVLGVTIITFSVIIICNNKRNKKKNLKKKNIKKKRIEDLEL
ncbi:MAG: cadherin-like beta sandwich domain-containing protein [Bacilli bacterium]|nr:cadherin-like beta sandwich domain-containing protein [Bacilli bacterium]